MKTLSLVIALVTLIAVGAVTQSFADEYWIVRDEAGMPTVTNQRPADLTAGISGPFKYLRRGSKGHGNRHRVEDTVLYFRAMHYGKANNGNRCLHLQGSVYRHDNSCFHLAPREVRVLYQGFSASSSRPSSNSTDYSFRSFPEGSE